MTKEPSATKMEIKETAERSEGDKRCEDREDESLVSNEDH